MSLRGKIEFFVERNPAIDEWLPQFSGERAIGLFTSSGKMLLGVYWHKVTKCYALVVFNKAAGFQIGGRE